MPTEPRHWKPVKTKNSGRPNHSQCPPERRAHEETTRRTREVSAEPLFAKERTRPASERQGRCKEVPTGRNLSDGAHPFSPPSDGRQPGGVSRRGDERGMESLSKRQRDKSGGCPHSVVSPLLKAKGRGNEKIRPNKSWGTKVATAGALAPTSCAFFWLESLLSGLRRDERKRINRRNITSCFAIATRNHKSCDG